MLGYIIRRLLWAIPTVLLLVFVIFGLMRLIPGGPFDFVGDKRLPASVVENFERRYHLDWPFMWQFSSYVVGDDITAGICRVGSVMPGCDVVLATDNLNVSKGIIRGDLGLSLKQRGRPVNEIVAESFPISFQLGVLSIALAIVIGIPLGIISAFRQNTLLDYGSSFFAVLGLSVPNMVLGPLLIWIFPLSLGWFAIATWGAEPPFFLGLFPTSYGWEFWSHAILPTLTLGTAFSATLARLTRASLLQVIREDYIRTARAKGLREQTIIVAHALKNGLIPVITILGPLLALVVTGTFIVEIIFGIPGMGRHFVNSINNRDYAVITGVSLVFVVILIAANLIVDILYAWLDPRIRFD